VVGVLGVFKFGWISLAWFFSLCTIGGGLRRFCIRLDADKYPSDGTHRWEAEEQILI